MNTKNGRGFTLITETEINGTLYRKTQGHGNGAQTSSWKKVELEAEGRTRPRPPIRPNPPSMGSASSTPAVIP